MKRKLSDLISDNIKDYSDIKCHVCMVKLNSNTIAVDEKKDIYKIERLLKR